MVGGGMLYSYITYYMADGRIGDYCYGGKCYYSHTREQMGDYCYGGSLLGLCTLCFKFYLLCSALILWHLPYYALKFCPLCPIML